MIINVIFTVTIILMVWALSFFFSKKNIFQKESSLCFECGYDSFHCNRSPFSLHFYKILLIFIIFDIEIILILPCIFTFSKISISFFLMVIMVFIILMLGLLFEWYQGSLEWVF